MSREPSGTPDARIQATSATASKGRGMDEQAGLFDAPDDGAGEPREVPVGAALEDLEGLAASCTRCDLHVAATQTVFGAGPARARLLLVGEQPGDAEDEQGEPFVGPAGRVLDRGLVDAGIDRSQVYVTNVVKHFSFTQRGKRRIHKTPTAVEVTACLPWLQAEVAAVEPRLVVPLGATAGRALLGSDFRVTKERGRLLERDSIRYAATVHPSSVLRVPPDRREQAYEDFVDDLRAIRDLAA